jgi:GAF domain-containing protein
MGAVLPPDEPERLEALRRYEILDTPHDGAFDSITAIAADFFQVPISIVSLVDHDRIWFKSHHGVDVCETARSPGLCASAIFSPDVYHIRDAVVDPRALANPLVAEGCGLRFYAAAPLRTHDGFNIGTLCVMDRQTRELTASEAETPEEVRGAGHGPNGIAVSGKKNCRDGTGSTQNGRGTAGDERGFARERGMFI